MRVIEFVAGNAMAKVYRAEGARLSELTVYRIGSLGHPVLVGTLHHADDPDASDWTISGDYPIDRDERERVRVVALLAWRSKFGHDDTPGEEPSHVHDR